MRAAVIVLGLGVAAGLGTATLGWWTVPLVGLGYGVLQGRRAGGSWRAAAAGAAAWAVLLVLTARAGPVGPLAERVGGVFGLPGPGLMAAAVVFAGLLAGGGAWVGGVLRSRPQPHAR